VIAGLWLVLGAIKAFSAAGEGGASAVASHA
jgi:hypothetical protein